MMIMSATVASYEALYFDDVAEAVEYCHALVPHVVPKAGRGPDGEPPVVWFHVPVRSQASTRQGCYLFASACVIAAAERAGLETPLCGCVARAALPPDSVLLFGEDAPPPTRRRRGGYSAVDPRKAEVLGHAPAIDARRANIGA
jgi:hypothetical protein